MNVLLFFRAVHFSDYFSVTRITAKKDGGKASFLDTCTLIVALVMLFL